LSISESGEEVATRTEVVAYGAKGFEESLRLVRRLETLHLAFAPPRRLMRILRPIVPTLALLVPNRKP